MDIKTIIKAAGGPTKVGHACGITKQAVSLWPKVPPEHCKTVRDLAAGALSLYDIRSDIFDPPEQQKQSA